MDVFLHLIECLHYRSNVNVPQQLALCEAWRGLGALAEELHSFTELRVDY